MFRMEVQMRWTKTLFPSCIFMALAVCNACSTLPPPPPHGLDSSAVAICIDERAPWSLFASMSNHLLFVRLDGGPTDSVVRDSFIPSNFCRGDYFYLLNAPPGRYAVVGSFNVDRPSKYYIFYDEKLVRQTEVSVAPGSFAFIGEFVVHTTTGLKGADPVQRHYYKLSHPQGGGVDLINPYDLCYGGYLKEVQRDDEAHARFEREASSHFAESDWAAILKPASR
jgi:hypothetical protein